ncbi:MAG: CatB-related O-acetyltransferase [Deltaproteobacteria bacterium]|nr:CatB-related O-acetyltransferase [Deltaproteobacteria bacterium]
MIKDVIQKGIHLLSDFVMRQNQYYEYKRQRGLGTLQVGKHTYGLPVIDAYKGSERKVIIGSYCSIARNVVLVTGGIHPVGWVSTYPFRYQWNLPGAFEDGMPSSNGDIVIGSDVWIGADVMIMSGVTVGHGAVIAARSVVTRDIPPYSLVGGVPAKVIRSRFDPETVAQLLEIKWWEWDEARVRSAIPFLSGPDIRQFIDYCVGTEQG